MQNTTQDIRNSNTLISMKKKHTKKVLLRIFGVSIAYQTIVKIYNLTFLIDTYVVIKYLMYTRSKAKAGELESDSGLGQLARLTEINVDEVGVCGAKNFFEAKIEEQTKTNKFADEIRHEQEERRRIEEEKVTRRAQFQQRAAIFQQN